MIEVKLHDIGEGMSEAEIVYFFVKPGDHVKADDPLIEVQTDKMTAQIPAPRAGVIKDIQVHEGETVSVGTTVLTMESDQAGSEKKSAAPISSSEKTAASPSEGEAAAAVMPKRSARRILASPYTRKIARDHGVDIEAIAGTGPGGRVMDEDVYQYINQQKVEVPGKTQERTSISHQENTSRESLSSVNTAEETIPYKGRRKQIAEKMTYSIKTIPHCTHFEEVDVTEVLALAQQLKDSGVNVSLSAIFIKAVSLALRDFPIFNAELNEEKEVIHVYQHHNIGIAVAAEEGLIVPVIHQVEHKSIHQIHQEMKDLTARAMENKLTSSDLRGGTFTISNVGPLKGSTGATPIINHPQTGLLALHKTKKRPVVNEQDEIVIRSMMNISMSFDHRVADGATAVAFTNRFLEFIEKPAFMLVEMM